MTEHISPTSPKQDDIDIKKILLNFWSHWHWFLAGIVIALIIAFLINRYTAPIYRVNSSLLVKEKSESSPLSSTGAFSGQALEGFGLMGGNSNLYNQQEILHSWPIIRRTVEALNFEVSFFEQG
ncbi:hypothetical protein KA005_49490, partial [bacterium]|nr:hypothetical protein [bacterium]